MRRHNLSVSATEIPSVLQSHPVMLPEGVQVGDIIQFQRTDNAAPNETCIESIDTQPIIPVITCTNINPIQASHRRLPRTRQQGKILLQIQHEDGTLIHASYKTFDEFNVQTGNTVISNGIEYLIEKSIYSVMEAIFECMSVIMFISPRALNNQNHLFYAVSRPRCVGRPPALPQQRALARRPLPPIPQPQVDIRPDEMYYVLQEPLPEPIYASLFETNDRFYSVAPYISHEVFIGRPAGQFARFLHQGVPREQALVRTFRQEVIGLQIPRRSAGNMLASLPPGPSYRNNRQP